MSKNDIFIEKTKATKGDNEQMQKIEQLLLENEKIREEMQETMNKLIANNSKIYSKFVKMMEGQKPCTK